MRRETNPSTLLRTSGFTLIELLVVVTIIVVLLALLVPALDKAIYEAELAVCGARLDAVAVGAQTYALNFNRMYPYREAAFQPNILSLWDSRRNIDDRPRMREYIPINGALRCPLAPMEVDLAGQGSDPAGRVVSAYSSYVLWFGFSYTTANVEGKPMRKLGNRWTYSTAQVPSFSSDLLAMDTDVVSEVYPGNYASHPDADGLMPTWVMDNEPFEEPEGFGPSAGRSYALSYWGTGNHPLPRRGPIDNNYAHADGSVERIRGVEFYNQDKNMARLYREINGGSEWRIQTPTR